MGQQFPLPTAHDSIVHVAGADLNFTAVPMTDRTPTGRQVLAAMGLFPHSEYVVLQWLPGGDIEEIRPEQPVDVTGATTPRLIVAKADRTYRFVLNDHSMEWPEGEISGDALHILGAIGAERDIFLKREDEADRPIGPDGMVDLRRAGVEVLYARSREWRLNVQGVTIEIPAPEVSVRDAMVKAGFDVQARWIIVLKTASAKKQVDLDYVIDLREPGIEKLRLTPREINNGEAPAGTRMDFPLLPADQTWLDRQGYAWSTLIDRGRRWLILQQVALPAGFTATAATIAMEIPTAYPMAEIDMFYCHPHLARAGGGAIPQTQVTEVIAERQFQRWSRHRGAVAPWRPGHDSVVTHMTLIEESLNREVEA